MARNGLLLTHNILSYDVKKVLTKSYRNTEEYTLDFYYCLEQQEQVQVCFIKTSLHQGQIAGINHW